MADKTILYRYPHGYFPGGLYATDLFPPLTISSFQFNNYIIEDMEKLKDGKKERTDNRQYARTDAEFNIK